MAASTIFAISLSLWSENISTITVLQTKTPFSTSLRVIVVVIIQERQHCATRLFHQTCSHSPKYHSVGLYGIMLQKLETITLITIQKVRRNILNRKVHADYSFRHLRQPSRKFRPINKRQNTTPVKQVNDNVIVPFFYRRARAIFDKIVCVHNVNLVFDKLVITSLFVHAGDLNLVSPYLPRQLRYLAYPIPQDQHIVGLERWDHVRPVPKSKSCLRRPYTPNGFAVHLNDVGGFNQRVNVTHFFPHLRFCASRMCAARSYGFFSLLPFCSTCSFGFIPVKSGGGAFGTGAKGAAPSGIDCGPMFL